MSDTTSKPASPRIICGKCKNRHESAFEVRACYGIVKIKQCFATMAHGPHQSGPNWCRGIEAPAATVEQKALTAVRMVTENQLDYIRRLGGDPVAAAKYTMKGASLYIDRLKREGKKVTEGTQGGWEPPPFKVPLGMLKEVPDGYYAVQPDSETPYTFFRISRPKSGNYKSGLKIQTQHGPDYTLRYVIYDDDRLYRYAHTSKVEDDLLLLVVDTNAAAIAYAEKIGRCMRCNTELTDSRSRWYGIGPECEKKLPHIIDLINDRKGPYVPGWDES
jgi:hypothetical protein